MLLQATLRGGSPIMRRHRWTTSSMCYKTASRRSSGCRSLTTVRTVPRSAMTTTTPTAVGHTKGDHQSALSICANQVPKSTMMTNRTTIWMIKAGRTITMLRQRRKRCRRRRHSLSTTCQCSTSTIRSTGRSHSPKYVISLKRSRSRIAVVSSKAQHCTPARSYRPGSHQ